MSETCFLKTQICERCKWAEIPPLIMVLSYGMRIPPPFRECCPKCGGALTRAAGQFTTEQAGSWWSRYTRYVNFIKDGQVFTL